MEMIDDLPSIPSTSGSTDWAGGGNAVAEDGLTAAVREALITAANDTEVGPTQSRAYG
jgi:hypothetical protein